MKGQTGLAAFLPPHKKRQIEKREKIALRIPACALGVRAMDRRCPSPPGVAGEIADSFLGRPDQKSGCPSRRRVAKRSPALSPRALSRAPHHPSSGQLCRRQREQIWRRALAFPPELGLDDEGCFTSTKLRCWGCGGWGHNDIDCSQSSRFCHGSDHSTTQCKRR